MVGLRALVVLLACLIASVRFCGAKKLWGVDVDQNKDDTVAGSGVGTGWDQMIRDMQSLMPEGWDSVNLDFIDDLDILEAGVEFFDGVIGVFKEDETRRQLAEPGFLRDIMEKTPEYAMATGVDAEAMEAILELENTSPVLFRAKIEEILDGVVDMLIPLRDDLKDKDRLKERLREQLPALGIGAKEIDDILAMVDNPKQLNQMVKAQLQGMIEMFKALDGGGGLGDLLEQQVADDPELMELLKQFEDNPELMEQAYKDLLGNDEDIAKLLGEGGGMGVGAGAGKGPGGFMGGRAARQEL